MFEILTHNSLFGERPRFITKLLIRRRRLELQTSLLIGCQLATDFTEHADQILIVFVFVLFRRI
jgi:hypothetical protein